MKLMVRWRALLPVLLAAALVVFLATGPLRPLTDEERVRAVFEAWVEANLDRDFGRIWELMGEEARDEIRTTLAEWQARQPSDTGWIGLLERTGLGPEDVEDLDPRSFFIATQEGGVRLHPEVYEDSSRKLSSARIAELSIAGDRARVQSYVGEGSDDLWSLLLFLVREQGEWRTHVFYAVTMNFRILERKLAGFLPRAEVEPSEVDLIIGLGPDEPGPDEMRPLHLLLNALAGPDPDAVMVLIDPSPNTPWQGVIDIVDAVFLARVSNIAYAACGEKDQPPGVHLNGVPLLEFVDSTENPVPPDHPALTRIIGLSQE